MNNTSPEPHAHTLGIAGRLAQAFIQSRLTVLLALAAILAGVFATIMLPREEEPQINVPMFDIAVPFPGASAREVEERLITVGERRLWEVPGVEYLYSTAEPGMAMFIVRFKVGTNPEEAMTRIYTKTFANIEQVTPGAMPPLIKPRSIDDVPILSLTLSGADPLVLRRAAAALRGEISAVPNVSQAELIGGRQRQFLVHFDPAKLSQIRVTPLELAGILQASNRRLPAGHYNQASTKIQVETDSFIRSVDDLKKVVVGLSGGTPVSLSDVATVTDGADESEQEVWTSERPSAHAPTAPSAAVTIAVSKRRGANATSVSHEIMKRIDEVKTTLVPDGVSIAITRNYGESAKEKSNELLYHMGLATISVTLLIAFALGWREAIVVAIAIPVTLALTLLVYFLWGYTLNRITLFALIFSIGILVDDAIVVVENIHRHFMMKDGRSLPKLAVDAVAEVGNPTLLATWAVIAAILPMAFVGGLMGPYMRPIPVGASFAMLFSVLIAFIVSPWAFVKILNRWPPKHAEHTANEGRMDRLYRKSMGSLLDSRPVRRWYFVGMAFLMAASISLLFFKAVTVKMLPFDNKNEFEVVLNMPESSSLSATRQAALEMADALKTLPEAERVTTYVGTAAPYNFNGLVRHYFLRQRPHQANITVNLSERHARKRQSHAIAKEARSLLFPIATRYTARFQVAEVPPGPPVLSTLVFEIYGPDPVKQRELAVRLRALLLASDGVNDVDTYIPSPEPMDRLMVRREKATLNGIPAVQIAQTAAIALEGQSIDLVHLDEEREPVEIRLRLPETRRQDLRGVQSIAMLSRGGTPVTIGELTRVERRDQDPPIFHKNLQRVAYVIADVAGKQEAPVYALLALRGKIDTLAKEMELPLTQVFSGQPETSQDWVIKWDGEWQITYEVFRDLGLAFAIVLILIYILVVAWFEDFWIPIAIMAPIPLTLVGILPGHWLMGAYFTATSMIGFIAGAGIVVRNSIILVDFIQLRQKEGMALREAVIDAGAVRFRPMLLTAAAVVAGAGVILFDPIFQGLAVALMAGEVASTLLSRTAVPVLYYLLMKGKN